MSHYFLYIREQGTYEIFKTPMDSWDWDSESTPRAPGHDARPRAPRTSRPPEMPNSRNLARSPAKPALNRGRVQRLARRALLALGTASTSEVLDWTCVRKRRRANNDNRAARRALEQIGAIRIGRAKTIGRPMLWRLRNTDEEVNLWPAAGGSIQNDSGLPQGPAGRFRGILSLL